MDVIAEHAPTAAVLSLSGEMASLATQILTTMSAHGPDEVSALEAFFPLPNAEPEAVTVQLTSFLSPSTDEDSRISARILCGLVVPDWGFAPQWTRLPHEFRHEVCSRLISALQSDPREVILKLATVLGEWPHVLPLILRAGSVVRGTCAEQKLALLILSQLPPFEKLADSLSAVREVLSAQLSHATLPDMRIHAMGAAANIIKCLRTNVDKWKILTLIPLMAKALEDCLDGQLETSVQEALRLLVELACVTPNILRPHMASVEPIITEIAQARNLPVGTRRLATFFLTDCAKAAGTIIRAELALQTTPDIIHFVSRVAVLLMKMLLEINDEVALPMVESEEEISGLARHCLHRLANAIGGTLMPVAMHWLCSHQNASDWKQCYAIMVTITELAEGCANVMIGHLDDLVRMVTSGIEHTHPIVHWVTIDAIAALYANLGLQMPHCTDLLLLVVRSMNVSLLDPHLKEHATQAVLEIIKTTEPDMLEPIFGEVLNALQLNRKAEEVPLVVATIPSSSAVAADQPLLPTTHATVLNLPVGIEQTRALGATQTTCNKQQADERISDEAMIGFLKAFTNGGVTSISSLTCLVAFQIYVKDLDPWTIVVKTLLFVGITFSLATAGVAHALDRHPRWLEAASTMALFEGLYTIILGGGYVGLANTSARLASAVCAVTMVAAAIGWSCIFQHPKWITNPKEWMHYQVSHSEHPQEARAGLFKSIGEVWQRINGQDDGVHEHRGGWLSKFRQLFRWQPAGRTTQTVV